MYRSMWTELENRGYTIAPEFENDQEVVLITKPGMRPWRTTRKRFMYPFISTRATEVSDDKSRGNKYVQKYSISVPETIILSFGEPFPADKISAIIEKHREIVVKPDAGYAGLGVTVGVKTVDEARIAIKKSQNISQRNKATLIQQQVYGNEVRFVYIDQKVAYVLMRQPLQLVGDGVSTVRELIKRENAERVIVSVNSKVPYPPVETFVSDAAILENEKILANNEKIQLARSSMISGGASVYDITDAIHPSYKKAVEVLIAPLNTDFLVVDIFVQDILAALTKENAYFNEFNRSPSIKLFYSIRDSTPIDIVNKLGSAFEKAMQD